MSIDLESDGTSATSAFREHDIPFHIESEGATRALEPQAERPMEAKLGELRKRTLARGVNRPLYAFARALLVPFFRIWFRLEGVGGARLSSSGPLLLASNHRSFLDPFVVGALMKRPVYYVAKRELFEKPLVAWLLGGLGAFPIDRGSGDEDAMATAREILQRGDCVLIFPEGTRVRPGPLAQPRRGVGRLALETGVTVVPVAVIGTEDVRKGWRIRPRRVRVRFGREMSFPCSGEASPALAAGVTARIWACVNLQWEWLGGARAPVLRALAVATAASRPHDASRAASTADRETLLLQSRLR